MVDWKEYLSKLLAQKSVFDDLTFSFKKSQELVEVPAIIKSSNLMLDLMIKNQGKFNIFVFPERIESGFMFIIIRLLHNILEGRIGSSYNPENFNVGDKLKLGNAVAEFEGFEIRNDKKCIKLKFLNMNYLAPITYLPYFQKTNASKLNRYEKFAEEVKKVVEKLENADTASYCMQLISDYKTHMKSSIVAMTPIINTEELLNETLVCGQKVSEAILVGRVSYDGSIATVGKGQLKGIPAIVLASDLYAIAELANKGHPIQSIILDVSNVNTIMTQLDALDEIIRIGVPITCVTDAVNSFDLNELIDRGFNLWRWDENTITEDLFGSKKMTVEKKTENCLKRKVSYTVVQNLELLETVKLLFKHSAESRKASSRVMKAYDKLFALVFAALREVTELEEAFCNQAQNALEECLNVIKHDKMMIAPQTYEEFCYAIELLKQIYSREYRLSKREIFSKILEENAYRSVVLVVPESCNKNKVLAYWQEWLKRNKIFVALSVVYPSEFIAMPCGRADLVVVACWIKRAVMRRILYSYVAREYVILLYESEESWKNFSVKKWAASLEQTNNNLVIEKSLSTKNNKIVPIKDFKSMEVTEFVSHVDELTEIETVLHENKYRQYSVSEKNPGMETVVAIPVNFVGGQISFYRETHKVISATRIIEIGGEKIETKLSKDLRVGDFIVVRESGHDIVKEMADVILEREGKSYLRKIAAKWKEALLIETVFWSYENIHKRLSSVGCKRGFQTVKNWITNDEVIAPQSREDIEYIAQMTKNKELSEKMDEIFDAALYVRQTHVKAGRELSDLLKAKIVSCLKERGDIDPLNIWEPIEMYVDKVGLVKILKITNIGNPVTVEVSNTNRLIED